MKDMCALVYMISVRETDESLRENFNNYFFENAFFKDFTDRILFRKTIPKDNSTIYKLTTL